MTLDVSTWRDYHETSAVWHCGCGRAGEDGQCCEHLDGHAAHRLERNGVRIDDDQAPCTGGCKRIGGDASADRRGRSATRSSAPTRIDVPPMTPTPSRADRPTKREIVGLLKMS